MLARDRDEPGSTRSEVVVTGEIQMSRSFILVFGALCWAGVFVDAGVHLMAGDVLIPAGMGLAFVLWMTLRRVHYAKVLAEA
jgi:hypothetical protein